MPMLPSLFVLLFAQPITMPLQLIKFAMLEAHAPQLQLNTIQMILKVYVYKIVQPITSLTQPTGDV